VKDVEVLKRRVASNCRFLRKGNVIVGSEEGEGEEFKDNCRIPLAQK